jgi:hypothetical protein
MKRHGQAVLWLIAVVAGAAAAGASAEETVSFDGWRVAAAPRAVAVGQNGPSASDSESQLYQASYRRLTVTRRAAPATVSPATAVTGTALPATTGLAATSSPEGAAQVPLGTAPQTVYGPATTPAVAGGRCCALCACLERPDVTAYSVPGLVPTVPQGVVTYRPLIDLAPEAPTQYLGKGILGQPKVYVPNQPIRNLLRYLSP